MKINFPSINRVIILTLSLIFATHNAIAGDADRAAHIAMIEKFKAAFASGNGDLLQDVYTTDAFYFKRSGIEYYGREDVIAGLIPDTPRPEPKPGEQPPEIVIDDMDYGDKFGYIYGRVCSTIDDKKVCHTRWFLVTEKDQNGQWQVQADLDLPLLSKPESSQ